MKKISIIIRKKEITSEISRLESNPSLYSSITHMKHKEKHIK